MGILIVQGVVKVPVADSPLFPSCLLEQLGPFCHEGLGLASVARVTLRGQVVLLEEDPGLVKMSVGQRLCAECRLEVKEPSVGRCQGVQVVGNGWVEKSKEGKEDLSEPRIGVVGAEGSREGLIKGVARRLAGWVGASEEVCLVLIPTACRGAFRGCCEAPEVLAFHQGKDVIGPTE